MISSERERNMEVMGITEPATSTPPRLLVVEDDTTVRDSCVRLLRMNGYQAAAAPNGLGALQRLQGQRAGLGCTGLSRPPIGAIARLHDTRLAYSQTHAICATSH